ncbi:DUF1760-domain-containing protein [Choiromyces venosus 120613-1]|uniref:DUF1760-domain-containing protein n=1 Tax=Choiromyces venosus 120613-1 TaxID=1336337 RepID=A0A3N4JNS6_9PEZI|nr:DUF1760-domain-containing protein [Choiromyces venosus 120613-1]
MERIVTLDKAINAIKTAAEEIPPDDFISYSTILDVHLSYARDVFSSDEQLKLLEAWGEMLKTHEDLAREISWDLISVLLPYFESSSPATIQLTESHIAFAATKGNPREVFIKIVESLSAINWTPPLTEGEDEYEDDDDDEGEDEEGREARDKSRKETTGNALRKFHALLSALSIVHPIIFIKFPSTFLSTQLTTLLGVFTKAVWWLDRQDVDAVLRGLLEFVELVKPTSVVSRGRGIVRDISRNFLVNDSGQHQPAVVDAVLFLGALALHQGGGLGSAPELDDFLLYLQTFAAISATSSSPQARFLAHYHVSTCISKHPDEASKLIFASPLCLEELFDVLFPEVEISDVDDFKNYYPTLVARANLYYFLVLSSVCREKLGTGEKDLAERIEGKFLTPVAKALEGITSEDGGMEADILKDVIERIREKVKECSVLCTVFKVKFSELWSRSSLLVPCPLIGHLDLGQSTTAVRYCAVQSGLA